MGCSSRRGQIEFDVEVERDVWLRVRLHVSQRLESEDALLCSLSLSVAEDFFGFFGFWYGSCLVSFAFFHLLFYTVSCLTVDNRCLRTKDLSREGEESIFEDVRSLLCRWCLVVFFLSWN